MIVALVILIDTGCKKEIDYTNPENLSGTIWKYDDYELFEFISTNRVIEIDGDETFYRDYEVSGNAITFYYTGSEQARTHGVIEGEKMTVEYSTNGVRWVYYKQ